MLEPCELARSVFSEVRESFPELAMRDSESEDGEPQLDISAQDGLVFDVALYVYGDVLNLRAGQFWGEWLPCSRAQVVSEYTDAVSGLLSGRYRIVEHSRRGKIFKAVLQRPAGSG